MTVSIAMFALAAGAGPASGRLRRHQGQTHA
ncbi:hypothetical protein J2W37_000030 [Variovorax paradoxus]|nr:hypothetical protein [Variovorax paradoxus]